MSARVRLVFMVIGAEDSQADFEDLLEEFTGLIP
tara:strand:+ start:157 stop:258 length:102 start_codon:yes stop_codon:yes gene_type:complete